MSAMFDDVLQYLEPLKMLVGASKHLHVLYNIIKPCLHVWARLGISGDPRGPGAEDPARAEDESGHAEGDPRAEGQQAPHRPGDCRQQARRRLLRNIQVSKI